MVFRIPILKIKRVYSLIAVSTCGGGIKGIKQIFLNRK